MHEVLYKQVGEAEQGGRDLSTWLKIKAVNRCELWVSSFHSAQRCERACPVSFACREDLRACFMQRPLLPCDLSTPEQPLHGWYFLEGQRGLQELDDLNASFNWKNGLLSRAIARSG
jgi:hypothetical protein